MSEHKGELGTETFLWGGDLADMLELESLLKHQGVVVDDLNRNVVKASGNMGFLTARTTLKIVGKVAPIVKTIWGFFMQKKASGCQLEIVAERKSHSKTITQKDSMGTLEKEMKESTEFVRFYFKKGGEEQSPAKGLKGTVATDPREQDGRVSFTIRDESNRLHACLSGAGLKAPMPKRGDKIELEAETKADLVRGGETSYYVFTSMKFLPQN